MPEGQGGRTGTAQDSANPTAAATATATPIRIMICLRRQAGTYRQSFWFAAAGILPRRSAQNSRSPDGTSYLSTVQRCSIASTPGMPTAGAPSRSAMYLTDVARIFPMLQNRHIESDRSGQNRSILLSNLRLKPDNAKSAAGRPLADRLRRRFRLILTLRLIAFHCRS
jgi:hypothetical protein